MQNQKIKVVFMGTPSFSLPPLVELLKDHDFEVQAVLTQPDNKVGRKQILTFPPVKEFALKNNIPVLQPSTFKKNNEIYELLKSLNPDFMIVVSYGKMLPKAILDLPKYGCINLHPSLLPKYRGATPVEEALLHGDKETGITIMKMEEKMDSGPIIFVKKVLIEENEMTEKLRLRLFILGAEVLPDILKELKDGNLSGIPQNESLASYSRKFDKDAGFIDLQKMTAREILNRIRAYTPSPGCYLMLGKKRLKILEVEIDSKKDIKPGEILENGLVLGARKGVLKLKKVQLEGKNSMDIQTFLRGNNLLELMNSK